MATRGSRPRSGDRPASGQHFLKSRKFAAELVISAEITSTDLVLEIGAGRGKVTEELGGRARNVVAVEKDPAHVHLLVERFRDDPNVFVVFGDALGYPVLGEPFRVFGNIPFGITSALLRKLLDDPTTLMGRADLIVQVGAALKRTNPRQSNRLNLSWGPWWEFRLATRIPARCFEPMPSVDAALLSIVKRSVPLLAVSEQQSYLNLLQRGFEGGQELRVALRGSVRGRTFRSIADRLRIRRDIHAMDLDLGQWLEMYKAIGRSPAN